jgi:hypothetical protein
VNAQRIRMTDVLLTIIIMPCRLRANFKRSAKNYVLLYKYCARAMTSF